MENAIDYLPDECWAEIIRKVGHHHHVHPISLVSKKFLSLSNRFVKHLFIYPINGMDICVSKLLERFSHVRKITISCSRFPSAESALEKLLLDIADCGVNIEELDIKGSLLCKDNRVTVLRKLLCSMKKLRVLRYVHYYPHHLEYNELLLLADCLTNLEELDCFQTFLIDQRIEVFAGSLKSLRKIKILHDNSLSKQFMAALSWNCQFLTEVNVKVLISDGVVEGINLMLRNCRRLGSLQIENFSPERQDSPIFGSKFGDSICYAKSLQDLSLHGMVVSDVLLNSIVNADIPLKKLSLTGCEGFTSGGLSLLLQKYRSLTHFLLDSNEFTGKTISKLSVHIANLIEISISCGCEETESTMFELIANCPLLSKVELNWSLPSREVAEFDARQSVKSYNLRSLRLHTNDLSNKCLKNLVETCPNLQEIELNHCHQITFEGIEQVLKSCNQLKRIQVFSFELKRLMPEDSKLSRLNLEVIEAVDLDLDDVALASIAMRCPRLQILDIRGCHRVTSSGVWKIMQNCEMLTELNLGGCVKVDPNVLLEMVLCRPSLRKIISSWGSVVPTDEQRKIFLHNGCIIY